MKIFILMIAFPLVIQCQFFVNVHHTMPRLGRNFDMTNDSNKDTIVNNEKNMFKEDYYLSNDENNVNNDGEEDDYQVSKNLKHRFQSKKELISKILNILLDNEQSSRQMKQTNWKEKHHRLDEIGLTTGNSGIRRLFKS